VGLTLAFGVPKRVASWGREEAKFKAGAVVALFMQNRPEFFITWLGLAKVSPFLFVPAMPTLSHSASTHQLGVTIALINTNLNGKPLEHVITVSNAQAVIMGSEQIAHVDTCR